MLYKLVLVDYFRVKNFTQNENLTMKFSQITVDSIVVWIASTYCHNNSYERSYSICFYWSYVLHQKSQFLCFSEVL